MTTRTSREWDSAAYDRISAPQFSWGRKVLDRVSLGGGELILDAGCGTGKLTAELLGELPRGRVIAVDLSRNMLRTAEGNLRPRFGHRAAFVAADLQHLPFSNTYDGIFSTAAFHWVPNHDLLFSSLHRALRPGGWLIAQCGGAGNLGHFLACVDDLARAPRYSAHVGNYRHTWVFAGPAETAERLRATGFEQIETSLEPAPTSFASADAFVEFVSKVILHRFLEHLPRENMRREFMNELAAQAAADCPALQLDYVRLNISCRKPAG